MKKRCGPCDRRRDAAASCSAGLPPRSSQRRSPFFFVGGIFAAQENMAAGETEVASVSARAALARAQRGDPPTGNPAAQHLTAAAAAPSFFDFAAGAVYRTFCPFFGDCNEALASEPATPSARNARNSATSAYASQQKAATSAETSNYPDIKSQNVKPPEFISPSPSNGGLAARSRAASYESASKEFSAYPASDDGSLPRPAPQPLVAATPADNQRLALLGAALAQLYDQKLAALDTTLRQVIFQNVSAPLSLPASGGTVNNIALSQRIDNLSGTTIENPTITGGSITASSITGTITSAIDSALAAIENLTATELVATNATTTSLFVKSAFSSPQATIGSLQATSSLAVTGAATSSFTGGIATARINASGTSTLAGIALTSTDCSSYANGGTLTTDAFGNVVCAADDGGAGGSVGGANTQIQFNDSGSFGGDSGFTYNKTADRATLVNASTTNVTATYASSSSAFFGVLTLPTLSSGALAVDANGTVYAGATSTLSTISGTLALNQVANIAGNTILGNSTGSSGNVIAIATSTLFGTGAAGQFLTWSNGIPSWTATSTYSCTTISCSFANNTASFSIPANAIALSQLATVAANTVLVNNTGSTGNVTAIATSTLFGTGSASQVLAWSNGVPTWTATTTFSAPLSYANGAVSLAQANGSTNGYLSSADWTTFNGKLATVTADAPLSGSGTSGSHLTLDTSGTWSGNAGTATKLATARTINGVSFDGTSNITVAAASSTALADYNTWTNAQTFSAAPVLSTLSGLLKGNGASALTAAAAGTDYAPPTSGTSVLLGSGSGGFSSYAGSSCTNQFVRSFNGAGVATCASVNLASDVTGTLGYGNGGTGTTTAPQGQLIYGGASSYQSVATTSLTASGVLSLSNPVSVIGAAASALSLTGGSNGQSLAWNAGAPAWMATTTFSGTTPIAATQNGNTWSFTWSPSATAATSIPYASTTAISSTGSAYFATGEGNVGIGTTVNNVFDQVGAARPLVVQSSDSATTIGGSGNTLAIINSDTTTNNTSALMFGAITGASTNQYTDAGIVAIHGARTNATYQAGQLAFLTSSATSFAPTEKMRITNAGNVGIGTTNPTRLLTVGDGTGTRYISANGAGAGSSAGSSFLLEQHGVVYAGLGNASSLLGGAFSNDLVLYNASSTATRFYTSGLERVRIDSSGNVGIGTTNPLQPLQVRTGTDQNLKVVAGTGLGNSSGVGFASTNDANSASEPLSFYGSSYFFNGLGNVGIGTTSPQAPLYVKGTYTDPSLTAYRGIFSIDSAGGNMLDIGSNSSVSPYAFWLQVKQPNNGGATFPLSLNPLGGNVGIGIAAPAAKLQVNTGTDQNFIVLAGASLGLTNGIGVSSVNDINSTLKAMGFNASSYAFLNGNVGIASTSPWRTLSVTGTVGFDGLTAGAGAGALCLSANKEVTYSAGAGCTGSSQRFKHDIAPLDASTSLDEVLRLNPVSFVYNDDIGVAGSQVGLIAEQVQQIDPRLVATDASGTPFTVKYENLTAVLAAAIQHLAHKLDDLANTVASFADHFTTSDLTFTRATGDYLTVNHLHAGEACLPKSDGSEVCVTGDQLAALLSQSAAAGFANPSPAPTNTQFANPTPDPAAPPVIEIQGNNPAHLNVGDSYIDLGASITGPTQADLNLGIKTFLNGALVSNIVLDTSLPATNTIDYVATDQNGLTSTSTRTVIIDAPDQPAPEAPDAPPSDPESDTGDPTQAQQ